MIAVQKITKILEESFGIRASERVNKWLTKNCIPFTEGIVQEAVKATLEDEAEKIDEDPGIGFW